MRSRHGHVGSSIDLPPGKLSVAWSTKSWALTASQAPRRRTPKLPQRQRLSAASESRRLTRDGDGALKRDLVLVHPGKISTRVCPYSSDMAVEHEADAERQARAEKSAGGRCHHSTSADWTLVNKASPPSRSRRPSGSRLAKLPLPFLGAALCLILLRSEAQAPSQS